MTNKTNKKNNTMTTTVSEVVVQQLVAFQQQLQKQNDDVVVDLAIRNFQSKLEEWTLSNQLSGMTVDSNIDNSTTSTTTSKQIKTALLTCIDCILLSFDGSPSSSPSTSTSVASTVTDVPVDDDVTLLLEFISGIAATISNDVLQELMTQRVVVACAAAMDRTRVFGCRLLRAIVVQQAAAAAKSTTNEELSTSSSTTNWVDTLLPRMTDKAQSVRLAAIQACAVFTDAPQVQEALLWSLAHDPSVSNRCAALLSINNMKTTNTDTDTTDHVIARLRDVKPKVRVAAVEVLMQVDHETTLTSHQCATIVRAGLTDRYVLL
jgi:hypothetical protein